MVVTIEPGFYQVPAILADASISGPFRGDLDRSALAMFSDVRGIRLEDGDGPIDPTLKATTTAGSAVVRGLTGKVVVRASKSGCTANTGPWGAVPLERGVISAAPIYLQ